MLNGILPAFFIFTAFFRLYGKPYKNKLVGGNQASG